MGLFDEIEETVVTDDDDKNRLFETHQKSGKSIRNYEKFFIPIVVLVIAAIAAVVYFSLPGVGDQVRPAQDLYDAVYDHMLTSEKRTATDMTFYYCDSFYTAKVTVEPKSTAPTKPEDVATQFKIVARKGDDGTWQISDTAVRPKEEITPCQQ
jgi:hypothetical protein